MESHGHQLQQESDDDDDSDDSDDDGDSERQHDRDGDRPLGGRLAKRLQRQGATCGPQSATPSRSPSTTSSWANYNQFSLLEDAEDAEDEGQEEIMFVTEAASASRWTKILAIVDSGAVEHVLPERWLPCIQMEESPGSKAGKKYLSATGQETPNLGQKAPVGKTREGQPRGVVFQVAPVRKPLMSVAKMNEAGNDVNLRGDRPHIQNTKTKQITALRREGKTFILDFWIKHPVAAPESADPRTKAVSRASGFSRRG